MSEESESQPLISQPPEVETPKKKQSMIPAQRISLRSNQELKILSPTRKHFSNRFEIDQSSPQRIGMRESRSSEPDTKHSDGMMFGEELVKALETGPGRNLEGQHTSDADLERARTD